MTQSQLQKFETILNQRLQTIQSEIDTLLNELEEIGTYENVEDIEDLAQLETLNDNDRALLARLLEEKRAILQALKRIKDGTYGKCQDGTPISLEKLEADPLYEC